MDKRYQVFVSSTFEDLQEARREAMQALLTMDCIPTGMELFPATDDESLELIKRFIGQCDYYIVIVAGRYGSTGAGGKSYTEMEYDYATELGLPILAFLCKDVGKLAAERTEQTDEGKAALGRFRAKVEAARHVRYWSDPKELSGLIAFGMSSLIKLKPRVGWVRADQVADGSAAQEILKLLKTIDELRTNVASAESTPPRGTEELAQGEETITLHFRYEQPRSGYTDGEATFSWNEILAILGPILITQASEKQLKDQLDAAFRNRLKDKSGIQIYECYVRDEEFQQVKVQLRALGLIRELKDKSLAGGDLAVWSLTPYGDHIMSKVAAIRSSKAQNA